MLFSLSRSGACALCVLSCAATGQAAVHQWLFQANQPGGNYSINNFGGAIQNIVSTFDTVSHELNFSVTYSDKITKGFWLALNDGPNPQGVPGELALIYLDAQRLFDSDPNTNQIFMTAYAYNGLNMGNSWKDGTPANGDQNPDLIKGANEMGSWVSSVQVQDTATKRTISFTIDATDIINHSPKYPNVNIPWHGIGYDEQLGIWMHSLRSLDLTYGPDRGPITAATFGDEGWLDGNDFTTLLIPNPGSASLLAVGALIAARRKRR